jgi:hypothetical protein
LGASVVLWAGKRLSDEEELKTRRMVALLQRTGDDEGVEELSRFLPERQAEWTPDQLEAGAHEGPWLQLGGGLRDPRS